MANLVEGLSKLKEGVAPGVDGELKANLTTDKLLKLQKDLKRQGYTPKPNRRIPIPKPNGGTRHLGIASAIDKVVQSTIKLLLEPVLEKIFLDSSTGFRPGRSCHLALYAMKYRWQCPT
jgi:retron-type reverse transcriptase